MQITRIETFVVPLRWLFVRIETDEGLAHEADPSGHAWRNPVRRHPDGSPAGW